MSDANSKEDKQRVALVTGATGFVGSHLARHLVREGWQVHIVTRSDSKLIDAPEFKQMTNHVHDGSTQGMVACVAQAKPDVVFHLASLFLLQHATKDVESLVQSNVLFGNQLLEAMKVNGVSRIVNTSTSWQHYNNEDYNPVCLYAATKQAFEAILEYYVQACDIKAITLKLFDTYGSDDRRPKLFNLLNKAAKTGEPLDMSAGEQLIDLVHINDVTEAYVIAAQRLLDGQVSQHERYAVSSGQPLPLKALVQLYSEVSGQAVAVNWGARPYRYREVMVPWTKGLLLPQWRKSINLIEGLKRAFE
jgi:nucleoside-diphosphate-sugar epimerase